MEAHNSTVLITAILLGLSLLTALLLETRLTSWAALEILIILFAILLTTITLFGLWLEEPWAYPMSTVFFSGAIANLLWLFFSTKAFLVFVFGILVNISGIVICLVSTEQPEQTHDLETYEVKGVKETAQKKGRSK